MSRQDSTVCVELPYDLASAATDQVADQHDLMLDVDQALAFVEEALRGGMPSDAGDQLASLLQLIRTAIEHSQEHSCKQLDEVASIVSKAISAKLERERTNAG